MEILRHKKIIWALIAFSILSVVILSFNLFSTDSSDIGYVTVPVARGDIEESILTNGILQAKNQLFVHSKITGTLKKLYVVLGQEVKKNQLLAQLDEVEQKNAVLAQQSEVQTKLLSVEIEKVKSLLAKQNLARHQEMIKAGAISKAALQETETTVKVASLTVDLQKTFVEQARLALEKKRLDLNSTLIRAPMSGTVVDIVTKEGEVVVMEDQAPIILRLAQLEMMTVRAQVSEADIVKIKKGKSAYFSILAIPNKRFEGTLSDVELFPVDHKSKSEGVYYNIYFDVPNPQKILRIGMNAQVSIVLKAKKNALLIPSIALGQKVGKDQYLVKVLDKNKKIKEKVIRVGINNYIHAEVLQGLSLNELVVIEQAMDQEDKVNTPSKTKVSYSVKSANN